MSQKICLLSRKEAEAYERRNIEPNCEDHSHRGCAWSEQMVEGGTFYFVDDDHRKISAQPKLAWRVIDQTTKRSLFPTAPHYSSAII